MNAFTLFRRTLTYHWRANLAVMLGCAVGCAVLTGALLVGDSMRGTLRDLTLQRLGLIESAMVGPQFFQADLSKRVRQKLNDPNAVVASVVLIEGSLQGPGDSGGAEAVNHVQIVGTTPDFWKLFPSSGDPEKLSSSVLVNAELAQLLKVKQGDRIVARLGRRSDVPQDGLFGNREEVLRQVPFVISSVLPDQGVGRFTLDATQRIPRTLFVPIEKLASAVEQPGRANALLADVVLSKDLVASVVAPDDLGLVVRPSAKFDFVSVESRRQILEPSLAKAVQTVAGEKKVSADSIFTYLANTITDGAKNIPYSIVSGVDAELASRLAPGVKRPLEKDEILLNLWAVEQLQAKVGDVVELEFYQVDDGGNLQTAKAKFKLAGVVPLEGLGLDRDFTPDYPGISDRDNFADWDPPFPIDLKRVRKVDEDYWKKYRTTPKAFLRLEDAQRLWSSRFGDLTSVRLSTKARPAAELAKEMQPLVLSAWLPTAPGLDVQSVRQSDLQASEGSTDFGVLFLSFSFFLIAAAAMLVGLLFRLNIERRSSEVGVLLAVGHPPTRVRRELLAEGLFLAIVGAVIGLFGAVIYAKFLLEALTTSWRDAVSTSFIDFHWTIASLGTGALGSIFVAMIAMVWSLWGLRRAPIPRLMRPGFTFAPGQVDVGRARWSTILAALGWGLGLALVIWSALFDRDSVGAFFGGAILLLIGSLALLMTLVSRTGDPVRPRWRTFAVARLGVRNAGRYPSRTLLTAGLISLATFLVAALGAMSQPEPEGEPKKDSGDGGFKYVLQTDVSLPRDLSDSDAREALGLGDLTSTTPKERIYSFRVRSGDDASCLNIYQPRNPTILGAPQSFLERGGFAFGSTLAETVEEKANPWLLLNRRFKDGALPVVGDGNTLQWILKVGVGKDLVIADEAGRPLKLRVVAALTGSIFQGELVAAQDRLLKYFPSLNGYRFALIPPMTDADGAVKDLRDRLGRYGVDVQTTGERLAAFRAVEHTYMATFQALGGLGLLFGTLGLGVVLVRNVVERRGELALLQAVGYRRFAIGELVLAETLFLLTSGLLIGAGCALVAVAPRWSSLSLGTIGSLFVTLLAILAVGLLSGLAPLFAVFRQPLIPALRAE